MFIRVHWDALEGLEAAVEFLGELYWGSWFLHHWDMVWEDWNA